MSERCWKEDLEAFAVQNECRLIGDGPIFILSANDNPRMGAGLSMNGVENKDHALERFERALETLRSAP